MIPQLPYRYIGLGATSIIPIDVLSNGCADWGHPIAGTNGPASTGGDCLRGPGAGGLRASQTSPLTRPAVGAQREKRPHGMSRRSGLRNGRCVRVHAETRGSSATASADSCAYASLTTAMSAASSSSVAEPRVISIVGGRSASADDPGASCALTAGCSRASWAAAPPACHAGRGEPWRWRRGCSPVR